MPATEHLQDLFSRLTEGLANLSLNWVLIGVGLLLLLMALLRASINGPGRRSQHAIWLLENLQVIVSVIVVVFLIIRPYLFQAFYIPSPSMEPTLMGPPEGSFGGTGDRLLVNKLIYRLTDPARFDIAVFRAPPAAAPDEKEYIKRVIGRPGETIEVAAPRLLVDGRALLTLGADNNVFPLELADPETPRNSIRPDGADLESLGEPCVLVVKPAPSVRWETTRVTVDGQVLLEDAEGRIQRSRGLAAYGGEEDFPAEVYTLGEGGPPRLILARGTRLEYQEGGVLINGQKLDEPYVREPATGRMAPRTLGPHEYFMMGDNRNHSSDSRAWGPLERNRIIGRAEVLFWPPHRFRIFHWWLLSLLLGLFAAYQVALRLVSR